ncbi:hypothetical protein EZS27_013130 [termite gut metagenome]|uniref:InsA N-terminal zinc ribbon domain-containing protein n=1 Tax=termite gut metagenome TaxID=433724 RepID=A0A5J4S051_9ZZZZ
MNITITLHCPDRRNTKIKKNGKKTSGKQNYLCKNCSRRFIGDRALTNKGCHSGLIKRILLMLVRGIGIRDISEIQKVSVRKVLSVFMQLLPVSLIMRDRKRMNFGHMWKIKVRSIC